MRKKPQLHRLHSVQYDKLDTDVNIHISYYFEICHLRTAFSRSECYCIENERF